MIRVTVMSTMNFQWIAPPAQVPACTVKGQVKEAFNLAEIAKHGIEEYYKEKKNFPEDNKICHDPFIFIGICFFIIAFLPALVVKI